jgi:hypothetical protein
MLNAKSMSSVNSKIQTTNSKQIPMTKIQNIKQHDSTRKENNSCLKFII